MNSRREQTAALALGVLLLGLLVAVPFRRSLFAEPEPQPSSRQERDAVLFDRFSAHRERTEEGDRLSISLRLRTSESVSLPCYVFVVARTEQTTPKLWAIWPPQAQGPAVTVGGHFLGATPTSGYAVTLSDQWERITATLPQPANAAGFDSVVLYVLDQDGSILVARPFRV